MPSDYYILIDGVNGESQADGMTNYIDLDSWSFGISSPAELGGKGLSGGKPSVSDFSFSCSLETSSYQVVKNLVQGTHIATGTFKGRKTGGGGTPYIYLQITLTKCFVTSFSVGGGSTGTPSCSVSLAFEEIKYEYFTQDTSSGSVTSAGSADYDIKKVKST
ncbi:MAG TPA: type VI secretion system tube protein Hcp [Terriglobia bacterium]|nr:type VI secretion system tube protein Hcp [Terriglobia bacterium]